MSTSSDALKAATLGSNELTSANNPLGASNAGVLSKLYAGSSALLGSNAATNVKVNEAQRAVAAARAAAAEAKQRMNDLQDPTKYRKIKSSDGGYNFYDPSGKPIDIATLTQRTKTDPSQWISDSKSAVDVQYTEDFKNLEKFGHALLSGDKKSVDSYIGSKPELKNYSGRDGYNKLVQDFQKYYQHYYVPKASGFPSDSPFVGTPGGSFGVDASTGL